MKRSLPWVSTAFLFMGLAATAPAGLIKKPHFSHKEKAYKPPPQTASKQPDKELYDKAMVAMEKGHFDVARLDLQTMLNTYPESEYQMRAKLAVGDSWFKEGGTAALTQAESEYKDFITFFPNQPEAAEAQMRVADIYYMQMEKPDRDHTNADRAEAEYKTMIQQFPDSPLVPRAKQKLREVQEVLAERQYDIGAYYISQENWPASIARLQTLTDTYPLYSHSDLALLYLGDAYRGEARRAQLFQIDAKAKRDLIKAYDDRAAEAYARVVTHYSMAPHVEDARERLIALNRNFPEPNQQQLAESEAEEQSRVGVNLKNRAMFLMRRGPSTVNAARIGDPTLTDVPQTTAPQVNEKNREMIQAAMTGKPLPPIHADRAPTETASDNGGAETQTDAGSQPLQLENVPGAGGSGASTGVGASIVTPGSDSGAAQGSATVPRSAPEDAQPAESGASIAATAAGVPGAQNPGGLTAVGPTNNKPLPPIEKPAEATPQINDVHGATAAQVQTGTTAGKKKAPAPKYDSSDESSSKHKKKKGLDKLNPF